MKKSYLKTLDIVRLIISILLLVLSIVFIALPFVSITEEDMNEVGEAVLIIGVFAWLIAIPIIIASILGTIRYFISRKKELTARKFSVLGLLLVILLMFMSIFINLLLIPCAIYIICDVVEYVQAKKSRKEVVVENKEALKSNYCPGCGAKVNELDMYCGICGKKLK